MQFPDDDNGDVLRRMHAGGDQLSAPRNVDFTVVFSDEQAAERFANYFTSHGYKTSVSFTRVNDEWPWDVVVVRHMAPDHEAISKFESALDDVAKPLGGRNDGWGCFRVTSPTANLPDASV